MKLTVELCNVLFFTFLMLNIKSIAPLEKNMPRAVTCLLFLFLFTEEKKPKILYKSMQLQSTHLLFPCHFGAICWTCERIHQESG